MTVKIINGDCRQELANLPDASVHCCVTSPPYFGLRDYGHEGQIGLEQTPDAYVAELVAVFREVRRVLRDDGTLWLNLGDSYVGANSQHRESGSFGDSSCISKKTQSGIPQSGRVERNEKMKMEGAKVEIKSKGHWAHGEWGIVRKVIGDEYHVAMWDGKEMPVFAKKELKVISPAAMKAKDLIGIPWRVAFALQADGWYLRQDIIWHKPNPMPESVTDRCTKAHEYIFLMSKSQKYYFNSKAILEPYSGKAPSGAPTKAADRKSLGIDRPPSSFGAPANEKETNPITGSRQHRPPAGAGNPDGRNRRSVWTITTKPYKGAHFATFPPDLITPCIMAGCPVEGTVLDPFGGSGTTGEVAESLGRNSILIELNPAYVDLIEKRTSQQGLGI